jgi:hypothetical protein
MMKKKRKDKAKAKGSVIFVGQTREGRKEQI